MMRRFSLAAGLLLAMVLPAWTAPGKTQQKPAVDAETLPPGQYTGTVLSLPDTDHTFTVQIKTQEMQLKPGTHAAHNAGQPPNLAHQQEQILLHQQRMASSRHPEKELRQIQHLQVQMQAEVQRYL